MAGAPQTVPAEKDIWLAEGSEKRLAVREMFDEIAPSYDLLNAILSLRMHHRWRAFAVRKLSLRPGGAALDICCGTGDFMKPLRKAVGPDGHVFGMDFSLAMLEMARQKGYSSLAGADACRLPVRSASVEAVTVGWGIRNVPDPDLAHREIARALKPGGRFVSLDMALPRNKAAAWGSNLICGKLVPWIGSLFGRRRAYTYLPKSTQRFISREALIESMKRAGFVDVGCKDLFFGNICLHWGNKP